MLRSLYRAVRRHTPREPRPFRFPIRASYVWGTSDRGQLGLGAERASHPTPVRLPLPEGLDFMEIVGGPNHLFARTKQRRWYGWGVGTNGQFGDRRRCNYATPTLIEDMNDATEVACGGYHTLMHNGTEGETFSSGEATGGCLGLGDAVPETRFRRVSELRGIQLRQMCAGVDFSLFLTERRREVLATGRNDLGQLGLGHVQNSYLPTPLPALAGIPVSSVACGFGHSLALTDDGAVYGWGANKHGQCGVGHSFSVLEPQEITFLRNEHIVQVAAGSTHSAALSYEGWLYIWGSAGDGKLGFGDATPVDVTVPRLLQLTRQRPIQTLALGVDHTLALTKTGELWGWGFGQHGALGLAECADKPVPTHIPWAAGWPPTDLLAGMDYSLAYVSNPNSEYDDD